METSIKIPPSNEDLQRLRDALCNDEQLNHLWAARQRMSRIINLQPSIITNSSLTNLDALISLRTEQIKAVYIKDNERT